MENTKKTLSTVVGGTLLVIGTALAIFLTPLKHFNLIEPSIRDIEPTEIYAKMQANPSRYLFIDVRPIPAYQSKHAVGSLNIDLPKLYYERKNLPKRGVDIILICSGGVASGVAYGYLEHYGYRNLYRVAGGIEAWEAAGLPIEGRDVKKTTVSCLDNVPFSVQS